MGGKGKVKMSLPGKITEKTVESMENAGLREVIYRGVKYDVKWLREQIKPKKRGKKAQKSKGLDESSDSYGFASVGQRRSETRESETPETSGPGGED